MFKKKTALLNAKHSPINQQFDITSARLKATIRQRNIGEEGNITEASTHRYLPIDDNEAINNSINLRNFPTVYNDRSVTV